MRLSLSRRPLALLLVGLAGAATAAGCSGTDDTPFVANSDVVVAAVTPPAISGGTLTVTDDDKLAIAADPDRDVVWLIDLENSELKAKVELAAGDEPGRVALDGNGRAHVALRSGGAVATIDLATNKLVEKRKVCAAPRGIAYDAASDSLHVACAGGELVTMPAAGGAATRTLKLERDLRDIVVQGDKLLVSRFRSAEVLVIGVDGKIWQREAPPSVDSMNFNTGATQTFDASVAWRMVARPGGGAVMVHQRGVTGPVVIDQPGGYGSGGDCDGSIVQTTVTDVNEGGDSVPIIIPPIGAKSLMGTALPVDIALAKNGNQIAIVAAGNNGIVRTTRDAMMTSEGDIPCDGSFVEPVNGTPIAAAWFGNGNLAVQLREPAAIEVVRALTGSHTTITLPGESRADTGHEIFHKSSTGFNSLACASCHPEAMDDNRTWVFNPIGARRTQSIRGGILATAPLHWDGDMESMGHIMSEVFVNRMGGTPVGERKSRLVGRWIDALPTLPKAEAEDAAQVERGKDLFFDAKVACASCHSGAKLTNNQSSDVGTGKQFQVPTLMGIADRAPFMHDGCAPTLRDRFTNPACGGGDKHGVTSHLTPAQVDDLVAYLETL